MKTHYLKVNSDINVTCYDVKLEKMDSIIYSLVPEDSLTTYDQIITNYDLFCFKSKFSPGNMFKNSIHNSVQNLVQKGFLKEYKGYNLKRIV